MRKIRKVSPSKQLEVQYRRELIALLRYMLNIALEELREPEKINDALPDYFKNLTAKMNRIFDRLDSLDLSGIAKAIASRVTNTANKTNAQRFNAQVSGAFGVDLKGVLTSSNQAVRDQLEIDKQISASLITNMATEFKQRISDTIMTSVQSGERSTNLISQIKEDYNVSENRAKLIARDQTSKSNGSLVRVRAEALGAKTYIWSGVADERERDSHRVLNGMLCKMSDPTVYSDDNGKTWKSRKSIGATLNHPTVDVNCRCNMLPVVEF